MKIRGKFICSLERMVITGTKLSSTDTNFYHLFDSDYILITESMVHERAYENHIIIVILIVLLSKYFSLTNILKNCFS